MSSSKKLEFYKRTYFLWIFALIWSFGAILLYFVDLKPLEEQIGKGGALGVVVTFTCVGLGFLVWSLSQPIEKWTVDDFNKVFLHQQKYLFKKTVQTFEFSSVDSVESFETKDSEGDAYFQIELRFKDGTRRVLTGSGERAQIELELQALKNRLNLNKS